MKKITREGDLSSLVLFLVKWYNTKKVKLPGSFFYRSSYIQLTREFFIHGKAMVPYVQLSTNCGLDNFFTVQFLFSLY